MTESLLRCLQQRGGAVNPHVGTAFRRAELLIRFQSGALVCSGHCEWWRISIKPPEVHSITSGGVEIQALYIRPPLPVMLSQAHARPSVIFVDEFDATSF
jgi:hypothetical protein